MRLSLLSRVQQALKIQLAVARIGDRFLHHRSIDQHLGHVAFLNDTLSDVGWIGASCSRKVSAQKIGA